MYGNYSGKAIKKDPTFDTDISKKLMNVPDNVLRKSASGYNIDGIDIVKKATMEGKKLGKGKAIRRLKI